MIDIFSSFQIAASGLTAQRLRMDVIANNVANIETTRAENGGAYQKQHVIFAAQLAAASETRTADGLKLARAASPFPRLRNVQHLGRGVTVSAIKPDETPGPRVYDPNHPDADEDGFVTYPNVNLATEMTDMLSATRSYEANVTVFNALKNMATHALELGRG